MSDLAQMPIRLGLLAPVREVLLDLPPVNALGTEMRRALSVALAEAEAEIAVEAVVIRAEGRGFSAGADIQEFGAPPQDPDLASLCQQLEAMKKPTVVAIHGMALGGGLELALAARGRIALADAQVGLPEVTLGILPGAGGTQRLPRLIGAEQALRLMLTGRPISAAEALALGILDQVVENGLAEAALAMVAALVGKVVQPSSERREGMRDGLAYQAACTQARARVQDGRLPAPRRIVDCVEAAQLLPFAQGQAFERAAFADLVDTPESAGLRHVFFAERAAGRMDEARVTPRALHRIGVMGAGRPDLVLAALGAGWPVALVDPQRPALVSALEQIAAEQERAVQQQRLAESVREAEWARLTPSLGAAGLADADLVLVTDAALLAEAAEATRPGCVLVLTGRGAGIEGPRAADMLGLRLPPNGRLGELVVGTQAAPEAVATTLALLRRMGRLAVRSAAPGGVAGRVIVAGRAAVTHLVGAGYAEAQVAAALTGFGLGALAGPVPAGVQSGRDADEIVTRVLSAMANEGARLLGKGLAARPSDIDLGAVLLHGFPRWEGGPMFWADRRGLMILRRDLRVWAEEAPDLWAPAPLLTEMASRGRPFADLNRL